MEDVSPFDNIEYLSEDQVQSDYSDESSFSDDEKDPNTDRPAKNKSKIRRPKTERDTEEFEKALSQYFGIKPEFFNPPLSTEEEVKEIPGSTYQQVKHRKNSPLKNKNWEEFSSQIYDKVERQELVVNDFLSKLRYLIISQDIERKRREEKKLKKKKEEEEKLLKPSNNYLKPPSTTSSLKSPSKLSSRRFYLLTKTALKLTMAQKKALGYINTNKSKAEKSDESKERKSSSTSLNRVMQTQELAKNQVYRVIKDKIPTNIDEKSMGYYKMFILRQPPTSQVELIKTGQYSFQESIKNKIKELNLIEKWKASG